MKLGLHYLCGWIKQGRMRAGLSWCLDGIRDLLLGIIDFVIVTLLESYRHFSLLSLSILIRFVGILWLICSNVILILLKFGVWLSLLTILFLHLILYFSFVFIGLYG
jgi:hypothetical protein